jgi:hypothetical protein
VQNELPLEKRRERDYAHCTIENLSAALIVTAPALAGLDPPPLIQFRSAAPAVLPVVTQKQITLRTSTGELFDYPPKPCPVAGLAGPTA